MTIIAQDDHLTAGAWPPVVYRENIVHVALSMTSWQDEDQKKI